MKGKRRQSRSLATLGMTMEVESTIPTRAGTNCIVPLQRKERRRDEFAAINDWGKRRQSRGATEAEIVGWREDKNPRQFLAKIGTKVPQIAGDEVRTAGFDSCQKDGDVFFGQVDASRQLARRGVKKIEVLRKPVEAAALGNFGEVDTGFFQGITGSAKLNIGQLPKPQEARVGTIRGGEQDIGVKEEPVHGGGLFG